LQYIPYRTYNRLLKENCQIGKQSGVNTTNINSNSSYSEFNRDRAPVNQQMSKIVDLEHLEIEHKQNTRLRGGGADEPHNLNSAFQWLRKYF
jgi:hypothetical protein